MFSHNTKANVNMIILGQINWGGAQQNSKILDGSCPIILFYFHSNQS